MSALRIALLTYRGNPRSGGQGVYVRHLSRELAALGHRVEVLSGPPYPEVDDGVRLTKIPGLDLFAEPNPFRTPRPRELRDLPSWVEFLGMRRGGFPEPLAFSLRAARHLAKRRDEFDIVHDNQGLGYGMLHCGLPTVATIHHPIAVDRALKLATVTGRDAARVKRWYGFVGMQHRVARRLPTLTVSRASRTAIGREMGVPEDRIHVVPLAADTRIFRPRPGIRRIPGRVVATASADEPLKGLEHLLAAWERIEGELVIVGKPKPDGPAARALARLGPGAGVRFVTGLTDDELARLLCSAEIACVPSLFEGFSLPAAEAMACGTPVVATTGGALPEVVGDAGILVPPGDVPALAEALTKVLGDEHLRADLAARGRETAGALSWRRTAEETAAHYRRVLGRERAGC
ncbi:glycosyl transferase family 1 [Amycolatopsis sp. WAC 01375]|uniref:glycosyltransferase family 4 protein n=1 Tax=unclassified Amycolatopsis TaxID=2618356 RepID=UPI000F772623|nr:MULTISPECIES: glycosyltransferase family 1 protein [unclassified Amycolatopsis]RSM80157.1 glycosyl transferase family 1 [Amycolatopsis sp. WAC 01375]RSN34263.1 glycosyl transferase family 1 [Amycolatopsis sp. WAC 01416]